MLAGCRPDSQPQVDRTALADEIEAVLKQHSIDPWYPRVIDDEHGGFLSRFNRQWQPEEPHDKFIVTQARHTWTTAKAAGFFEDSTYLYMSRHGFEALRDIMWDVENGGFVELMSRVGERKDENPGMAGKRAYGNAFGIYALAAYYRASRDEDGLEMAKRAFQWLDEHAHDPEAGGYFQFMQDDGTPMPEGHLNTPPKDQNSSIHLLEAFTELYQVWPDSVLRIRLEEMLYLIRDTITRPEGYLTLFSNANWAPVSYRDSSDQVRAAHHHLDHVSFGHDIETAYLMLEASEVLGMPDDEKTHRVAKRMVDHTLMYGWDAEAGGIYDGAYYFANEEIPQVTRTSKAWWAQAEAMNTLLIMADQYPDDPMDYWGKFMVQWEYLKAYLIDHEFTGWYSGGIDEEPDRVDGLKAQIWKGNYHDARSLMNVTRRLQGTSH